MNFRAPWLHGVVENLSVLLKKSSVCHTLAWLVAKGKSSTARISVNEIIAKIVLVKDKKMAYC